MNRSSKTVLLTALVAVLMAWFAFHATGQPAVNQAKDGTGFDAGRSTPAPPPAPEGMTVLSFDDGSFESGLGVAAGAYFDGVVAMAFGGSPATTGAVPLAIRGAYWRMYPGFGGATQVQLNFWHPLNATASRLPTNPTPIYGVAGNTNTTATQFASAPAGPTVSTANGSVAVGVNVLGTTSWFVAGDTNGPQASRGQFGAGSTLSVPPTIGAPTLSLYVTQSNYIIRLLIDGNVPVELQSFEIE